MGKRRLYRAARAAQGASPDVPPTWRERLAALRYVPPLLRLVFQTHRGYTVSILLLRVVRSFVPVAVLWIGKHRDGYERPHRGAVDRQAHHRCGHRGRRDDTERRRTRLATPGDSRGHRARHRGGRRRTGPAVVPR